MRQSAQTRFPFRLLGRILGYSALILAALGLVGCPGGKPAEHPEESNLLPIPPLGAQFTYEGHKLNWSLQPHPSILARPDQIEALKAESSEGPATELIGLADAHRERMEADPDYREATGPIACAWGYLLTEDEHYLDTLHKALDWLLEFPPVVRIPEGANIPFLQQAYALGGVYDLLYDHWTAEERQRIETVLRETVFHTLAYKVTCYDKDINFWAMDPDTNYYLTFHSTAGLVAIALAGVEPEAESLAEHCWKRVQSSMEAFAAENGWREGLTYLDFCWGQSACYFLLALERNTDLKPYNHPWFTASVPWAAWGALPDRETIACFGDNEPENYSVGSYLQRVAALTSDEWFEQESDATAQAVDLAGDLLIFRAACLGRDPTETEFEPSSLDQTVAIRFPGIEWGVIRSGPGGEGWESEDDFYCAFKSGVAGYDHNHLDQGSLILAAYSEVLISDPGRGGPDIIRQDPYINCLFEAGLGHNTLIVGHGCYFDLELFPDNPKYYADPGRITSEKETNEYIQFTTNNSGLYPTEPLSVFRRTFLYVKPGIISGAPLGALILADRVTFTEPTPHAMLFHTPGAVEMLETGRAKLTNGGARIDYTGFCAVPTADKAERQETTMPIRDSTCYYRQTEGNLAASDWVHVLIPARIDDAPAPGPSVSMVWFGVKIEWDDYAMTLMVDPEDGWIASQLPGTRPTAPTE